MHVFLVRILVRTAAISLALCAASAASAADKPNAYEVTAGFDAAPQSLYWYTEGVAALNGDMGKSGFLMRSYGSISAYNYVSTAPGVGQVDGRLYQIDAMPGYQVVRDGITVSGNVGVDYQDVQLSPNDPTAQVNGTKTGFKVAASVSYDDDKQPITGSLDAEYSTAFATYYAELRVGLRLCKNFVLGPAVEADGDTGYNGQRVGGYATYTVDWIKDQPFDVTLTSGHQFVDTTGASGGATGFGGSSGTYGSIEIDADF